MSKKVITPVQVDQTIRDLEGEICKWRPDDVTEAEWLAAVLLRHPYAEPCREAVATLVNRLAHAYAARAVLQRRGL